MKVNENSPREEKELCDAVENLVKTIVVKGTGNARSCAAIDAVKAARLAYAVVDHRDSRKPFGIANKFADTVKELEDVYKIVDVVEKANYLLQRAASEVKNKIKKLLFEEVSEETKVVKKKVEKLLQGMSDSQEIVFLILFIRRLMEACVLSWNREVSTDDTKVQEAILPLKIWFDRWLCKKFSSKKDAIESLEKIKNVKQVCVDIRWSLDTDQIFEYRYYFFDFIISALMNKVGCFKCYRWDFSPRVDSRRLFSEFLIEKIGCGIDCFGLDECKGAQVSDVLEHACETFPEIDLEKLVEEAKKY